MKKLVTLMIGAAIGAAIAFWYAPEKTKAAFDKAQKTLKPLADDLTKMVSPDGKLPWESTHGRQRRHPGQDRRDPAAPQRATGTRAASEQLSRPVPCGAIATQAGSRAQDDAEDRGGGRHGRRRVHDLRGTVARKRPTIAARSPDCPPAFEGLTVLHLSDVHAGQPGLNLHTLRKAVEWGVSVEPDLVVLTGDIMGGGRGRRECLELLSLLRPRLGAYAVTGNHEYGLSKNPFAHRPSRTRLVGGRSDRARRSMRGLGPATGSRRSPRTTADGRRRTRPSRHRVRGRLPDRRPRASVGRLRGPATSPSF